MGARQVRSGGVSSGPSSSQSRSETPNVWSALAYLGKVAEGHPESASDVEWITHLGTLRDGSTPHVQAAEGRGSIQTDHGRPCRHAVPANAAQRAGGTRAKRAAGTRAERAVDRATERAEERAVGTRAERASERAVDRVKVANNDDNSSTYTDHLNATGTQNTRETTSKNVSSRHAVRHASGTRARHAVTGLIGHANRDVVHRAEGPKWHAVGRGGGEGGGILGGRKARFASVAACLTAFILVIIAACSRCASWLSSCHDDQCRFPFGVLGRGRCRSPAA